MIVGNLLNKINKSSNWNMDFLVLKFVRRIVLVSESSQFVVRYDGAGHSRIWLLWWSITWWSCWPLLFILWWSSSKCDSLAQHIMGTKMDIFIFEIKLYKDIFQLYYYFFSSHRTILSGSSIVKTIYPVGLFQNQTCKFQITI